MSLPTSSLRRRSLSAGTWTLAVLAFSQVVRFGGNLVMTRLLVPEMFGVMAIAITLSVVLALLSDIGLRQNIIQSQRGDDPVFLDTAWSVQIVRGVILCLTTLTIATMAYFAQAAQLLPPSSTFAHPELPLVLAVTGLSAIVSGFQSTKIATAYRSFQQQRLLGMEIVSQLIAFAVMILLGIATHSIWALVASSLVAVIVTTVLSHSWLEGHNNRVCWNRGALREVIRFGRWIFFSSALGVLAANGDRILLGWSVSALEIGVYSIAVLILTSLEGVYARLLSAIVLPAFSEIARAGQPDLRKIYYRVRLPVDAGLLLVAGLLFSGAQAIIDALYDERYSKAGHMLEIMSLALFIWRYNVVKQALLALGQSEYLAIDSAIRFASLIIVVPALLAYGGMAYAIWGIALHSFATLPLIYIASKRFNLFDGQKEFVFLSFWIAGWFLGSLINRLASAVF